MKISKIKFFIIIIFLITPALLVSYSMNMQKYQMYVRVTSYDINSSEFPSKKIWFDASEWLKSPQYIKVHDAYLINKKITPIEDLNILKITRMLQSEIDESNQFPELHTLKNLNRINFFDFMKDKMTYEYVYTKFDEESLKPILDFFLIKFFDKENRYELLVMRRVYKGEYFYDRFGPIYRENEWHKHNKDTLTYRDYLAGKIDSYK